MNAAAEISWLSRPSATKRTTSYSRSVNSEKAARQRPSGERAAASTSATAHSDTASALGSEQPSAATTPLDPSAPNSSCARNSSRVRCRKSRWASSVLVRQDNSPANADRAPTHASSVPETHGATTRRAAGNSKAIGAARHGSGSRANWSNSYTTAGSRNSPSGTNELTTQYATGPSTRHFPRAHSHVSTAMIATSRQTTVGTASAPPRESRNGRRRARDPGGNAEQHACDEHQHYVDDSLHGSPL